MLRLTMPFFLLLLLAGNTCLAGALDIPKFNTAKTLNAAAFTSLSSAKSSPLAVGKTILVSTQIKVNSLTIPSTVRLRIVKGGGIILGNKLTINGPFEAGLFQVFRGNGSVSGLKTVYPEWWGAKRDGITDDGEAIRKATASINTSGGGSIIFSSGKYMVYKAGQTYTYLGAFTNCTGINIISNGATLAQDPARVYTGSNGAMFFFTNCKLVNVNGFNVTGPVIDIRTATVKGNEFVQFNSGSEGLEMVNNKLQGVTGGLLVKDDVKPGNPCKNIYVSKLHVKQGWYGITGQNSGSDMIIEELNTDTVHRSLFIYGVRNVKAKVHSKDAYSYDVFLNSFHGSNLENIEIWYERLNETQNSSDGSTCIMIQASDSNTAIFRNIKLHLNIQYNSTGQTGGASVKFRKMTDSGSVFDTFEPGRGHMFDNIEITGHIIGNPHYSEPVIGMDGNCVWGNGDYFSNIRLINLTVSNNTRGITFYTGPFIDPLVFNNVRSSSSVNWAPNDSSHAWNFPLITNNSVFPNQYTFDVYMPINLLRLSANTSVRKGWSTKVLTNNGATSLVYFFLPSATPGLKYTITRDASFEIRIKPKRMETIGEGKPGKYLSLNASNNSVVLKCINPGEWLILTHKGELAYEQ